MGRNIPPPHVEPCGGVSLRPWLRVSSHDPPTGREVRNERHHQPNEEYEEEDLGDARRNPCHAHKPERARQQRKHQERENPGQHVNLPFPATSGHRCLCQSNLRCRPYRMDNTMERVCVSCASGVRFRAVGDSVPDWPEIRIV